MTEQPLAGVRVAELATGVAGPYVGKVLADFGADVIKAEPPDGDPARRHVVVAGDAVDPDSGALFDHLNANKRSVIATPERIDELADWADVLIESATPGTGPDLDELRRRNRGLVITSVTPFGRTGPYSAWRSDELITYAMAGPLHATGVSDREPVKMAGNLVQYQCGNVAAAATLGALTLAETTGRGSHVDVSNMETQAGSMDRRMVFLLHYAYTGRVQQRDPSDAVALLPTGIYPTAEGLVQLATPPAWIDRMLKTLDDADLAAAFSDPNWVSNPDIGGELEAVFLPWLYKRTKAQAMNDAQENLWAMTAMQDPVELLTDPHFESRGFFRGEERRPGPPWHFHSAPGWELKTPPPRLAEHETSAELPARARPEPAAADEAKLPLDGVRVIDLTVVWAGPYTTMILSDLGAEVIRVDNPWLFPTNTRGAIPRPNEAQMDALKWLNSYPDDEPGERPWNRVALFNAHARGKKSATADLKKEEAREAFLRLIEVSDVLVENNSIGVLARLGIDWDTLHTRNPSLILVREPAVGLDGPYADFIGFGTHFEALCGMTSIRGYADADPQIMRSVYHMDPATGAAGASATMMALRRRNRTGEGELIEVAQAENMVQHIGEYLVDAARTGRQHAPIGNRHSTRAPQGVYPCEGDDQWVAISVGDDDEWASLAGLMNIDDARFTTAAARHEHHDELDQLLAAWTANHDKVELAERCQNAGIAAGPVLDDAECFNDPHLRDRGWFRPNGSPDVGTHDYPGHLWKWDGPPLAWDPLCRMGNENEYVWKELAGLDDNEYARLEANGHLSLDYLQPNGERF